MIDVISLLLLVGVCAYVAAPLVTRHKEMQAREAKTNRRVDELLHQQQMAARMIEDLEFDRQTGKLSEEDFAALVADQRSIQTQADAKLKNISGASGADVLEKLEKEIDQAKGKISSASSRCPNCGSHVEAGAKFCSECGAKLISS